MTDEKFGATHQDTSDLIDLRELLATFRRRLWSFLSVATLVVAVVVLFTMQTTPTYLATSSVVLNVQQSQVVDFEAVLSGLPPDSATVDTEVEILRSRSVAAAVVEEMGLASVPEFNPALQEASFFGQALSSVTGLLSGLAPDQTVHVASLSDTDQAELRAHEAVINSLLERRSVRRSGMTYVIDISVESENPRLARDIANTYADQYLLTQLEAKFEATERANDWLNERVASLREEVRTREQAVALYREQAGLLDAQGSTLAEQQISDLNGQLAIQRAELAEAEARLGTVQTQLDRGVAADTIPEVLSSEAIRQLRNRQTEIAGRQAELGGRYGPRHPEILTVQREAADIEAQIEREISRIVSSLENEVNVARQRVRSLEGSLSVSRDELAENNTSLVRLRELEREAESSRALFESFLNRFRQTNESTGLEEADARIVARAALPTGPNAPNILLNLALGIVLAGVAGVGVVFLLELFDNGLRTDSDIERQLGLPHIASVPLLKLGIPKRLMGERANPYDYILAKPMSGFAESFRTIRSALRLSGMGETTEIVAVTSAVPGEGKTTTALCLGRITSMSGSSTIVVDCDLRRRLLTKEAVGDVERGLLEVLNNEATLEDAIRTDDGSGLHILPLSKTTFTPQNVFGTKAFDKLLADLRTRYDQIILDTPPVLAVADTREITSRADVTIVAALWKKSPVSLVKKAIEELSDSRAKLLGVVLNSVDLQAQARYGYDNSGYYYRSYRKYYSE